MAGVENSRIAGNPLLVHQGSLGWRDRPMRVGRQAVLGWGEGTEEQGWPSRDANTTRHLLSSAPHIHIHILNTHTYTHTMQKYSHTREREEWWGRVQNRREGDTCSTQPSTQPCTHLLLACALHKNASNTHTHRNTYVLPSNTYTAEDTTRQHSGPPSATG